jgi:invasion protein IalB
MRGLVICSVLLAVPSSAVRAAQPERVEVSGAWSVYRIGSGAARECFMHAAPTKSEGKYTQRGEVMLQVAHRPGQRVRDEVSFTAGYTFKPGSDASLDVDGRKFELFTHQDRAYARDSATDRALAEAMKRGHSLRVRGVSSRGTQTVDHFSLSGFSRAHKRLDEICGR